MPHFHVTPTALKCKHKPIWRLLNKTYGALFFTPEAI